MKNNATLEITSAVVLSGIGIYLINPFHVWMPTMLHMMLLGCAIVAFGIFAIFIVREKTTDERDEIHRMLAGRLAFLSGSAVLLSGIVAQSISDNLDPWLVGALVVMVLAKVAAHLWSTWYR